MSIKDILVCLDPTDAGERRLRLAAALARRHGAHLSAAYVMPEVIPGGAPHDSLTVAPPTGEAWMPRGGDPVPGAVPAAGADTSRALELADIVEESFRDEARPQALEGDWHILGPGDSADLVTLLATADLVVFGQTSPDYPLPTGFGPEDVVLTGGRPTLVVPYAGTFGPIGHRVLLAWDGTREAVRAVHDALPLLREAEAVTVMTVRDNEADFANGAPAMARLLRHLARHGIKVQQEQTLRGEVPIADLLLSRAADLDIDLIVAGAFHHSQFREALIGGVSRDLLDHMTVPVLMSH